MRRKKAIERHWILELSVGVVSSHPETITRFSRSTPWKKLSHRGAPRSGPTVVFAMRSGFLLDIGMPELSDKDKRLLLLEALWPLRRISTTTAIPPYQPPPTTQQNYNENG